MTEAEFLSKYTGDNFRYMLLDRMRSDCEYFINACHCHPNALKFLWANNAQEQIAYMRYLWNSFEENPEWCTPEMIDEYEKIMVKERND